MQKIGVVIPIIQNKYIHDLLECIENNSVIPDKIIIIDNSGNHDKLLNITKRSIEIYKSPFKLNVNASWNYGIQKLVGCVDLISILNDDLLLEKWFFEKLLIAAGKYEKAGVFCPLTVSAAEMIEMSSFSDSNTCCSMAKREGWAWTIRAELAGNIPPIPKQLKTWCGDDWYWHHCHRLNRPWMKMPNNWCFHYVGQSHKLTDFRKNLNSERSVMNTLLTGLPSPL